MVVAVKQEPGEVIAGGARGPDGLGGGQGLVERLASQLKGVLSGWEASWRRASTLRRHDRRVWNYLGCWRCSLGHHNTVYWRRDVMMSHYGVWMMMYGRRGDQSPASLLLVFEMFKHVFGRCSTLHLDPFVSPLHVVLLGGSVGIS
jgi:hypothetical protein